MRRPAALLTSLLLQGARVHTAGDQLRVEMAPTDVLGAVDRAALAEHEPELLRLMVLANQYRGVLALARSLRDRFEPMPSPLCDLAHSDVLIDEQARLLDDLGPALAAAILAHIEWHR